MKVYATFHPTAVAFGGYHLEARIEEDFRRLKRKGIAAPRRRFPNGKAIGFDTEYDSESRLLTVGLANAQDADAIETTEKDWLKKTRKVIRGAKLLVGHSVTGDLDHLVRLNLAKEAWLQGRNIKDSFLLARMYDENRGKGAYGLEVLMLAEHNFAPWKTETEKLFKKSKNAADWTPEQRIERCRLDAWATRILAEYFERKMR